jgi:hypothetical protein
MAASFFVFNRFPLGMLLKLPPLLIDYEVTFQKFNIIVQDSLMIIKIQKHNRNRGDFNLVFLS